jgi:hypothetical protein
VSVRHRKRLAVALLAALVGLAGCGVPGRSEPRTAGTAPGVNDPRPGSNDPELPSPNGISDPSTLADRFFKAAAAGDVDPTLRDQRFETAVRYAKDFLSPAAAAEWKPNAQVIVVDVTKGPVAGDSVTVELRAVGVLDEWGAIEPLSDGAADAVPKTLTIQAETPAGSSELRIKGTPPPVLMLSTTALDVFYEGRAVYFWDTSGRYLVPDRRYLNRQVNAQKRARAVVERLLDGPSQMVESAVNSLPANLSINSNPVVDNNRTTVNLSAAAALEQSDLSRLAMQLRWSLAPSTDPVEIQIDSRTKHIEEGPEYLTRNPTYRAQAAGDVVQYGLFGLVNGKVVRVQSNGKPMPVLAEEHNTDVVAASVNPDRRTAALVRQAGNRQELWFVREGSEGVGGAGGVNAFRAMFPPDVTTMGRPVYLPGSKGRFLVPSQGRLFDVMSDVTDSTAREVNLLNRTLKAISVAPDGRRVAMIVVDAGGAEHVIVGTVNPDSNPVSISDKRTLDIGGLTNMRGVAWVLEHQLVVSGANWLTDVTIDNSARTRLQKPDFSAFPVTAVAAVPRPNNAVGPMAIEGGTGNDVRAYWVYTETLLPVTAPSAPSSSPPPSQGAANPAVRGPFYPDLAPD